MERTDNSRFYLVYVLTAFTSTAGGLELYFRRYVDHVILLGDEIFTKLYLHRATDVTNKIRELMRAIIQRVKRASVTIEERIQGEIAAGLLVFVGIEDSDGAADIEWLSGKIVNMRIFNDQNGVMNIAIKDVGGNILLVSQFTLHASTKKGNRPSYIRASKPEIAVPLYEKLIGQLSNDLGKRIETGKFGADMQVELLNDGPVTIVLDSKNKE